MLRSLKSGSQKLTGNLVKLVAKINWEFCLLKKVERMCGRVFGLMVGEVGERE